LTPATSMSIPPWLRGRKPMAPIVKIPQNNGKRQDSLEKVSENALTLEINP